MDVNNSSGLDAAPQRSRTETAAWYIVQRYRFETQRRDPVPAILIKNAPPRVHDWLRRTATESRRSMTQQALYCFEWCMENMDETPPAFPAPLRLSGDRLTLAEIDAAKKAGRK